MLRPRPLLSLLCWLPLLLRVSAVACPATAAERPRDGVVELDCELVWEIPGESEDYLLGGLLVSAAFDHDGNLCVVDYRNADLKVFAPDGRWLRTLGGRGEGPGESRDARALVMANDGRVGLVQMFPAGVVWLQPDGTPAGVTGYDETPDGSPGFVALLYMVQRGETVLAYLTASALAAGRISERHWIAPLDLHGGFGPALYRRDVDQPEPDARGRLDEGEFYDVWAARWAPDGAEGIWVAAARDRYRIDRYGPDGQPLPPIEREYRQRERDEVGLRLAGEQMQRKRFARDEVELRSEAPVVRSLRLARTGELWVDLDLGGRGPAPRTIAWIDVHHARHGWLRQLHLRGPYDAATDQWRFVDDRHLLVLAVDDVDQPVLRLLRLPASGD